MVDGQIENSLYSMKDLRQLYLKTGENTLITFSHEDGFIYDPYRIDYLGQHFKQIDEAIDDGVAVIGYIMWGVIDIVSAGSCEMEKRYGVVYVDANNLGQGTYKRYKKDSFKWYYDFIENKHKQFN